jgi:AbrB family looped-hinge helix DNA binding protein
MIATIDPAGRVLLPKVFREALGLTPGTKVDISAYGSGLALTPQQRSATLRRDKHGHLVVDSNTPVTDDILYALIEAGRK